MLLANLYLLCWYYDRIKYILPFKSSRLGIANVEGKNTNNRFPTFFGCVLGAIVFVIVGNHFLYDIRPGNSLIECTNGCAGNSNPEACNNFCDCIYNQGKPLRNCLAEYEKANEADR
jgi:hypothetical protein